MFVYWGRRGSLSWMALDIARHLRDNSRGGHLSYSAENELAGRFAGIGPAAQAFPTFKRGIGALTGIRRLGRQIETLVAQLKRDHYEAVVVLMSHVWTPALGRRLRSESIRYVVVAHDAVRHPGDRTGLVHRRLLRDLDHADLVVTLSNSVAKQLISDRRVNPNAIRTVPHPALDYGGKLGGWRGDRPLRVLFLGRIMAYKGLGLLVEAVRLLKQRGTGIKLGVFGEGDIGKVSNELRALGAETVNRWIDHDEIGAILGRYDVLVLPYTEASQSGVAAAARSAGMPIVATPVGGLAEQIRHDADGLISLTATAESIADAIGRLADDPALYERLAAGAAGNTGTISIAEFAEGLREFASKSPPTEKAH